ncbi:MAG: dockerin type I repeat-containing protein, partial [Phycisphaerales bacterium]
LEHADLFGVSADDLVLEGPFADRRFVQPILWDEAAGDYRFYGVYYAQKIAGVPVHTGVLKLLVRNEPGYPLVLAAADLRPIGAEARDLVANAKPPRSLRERDFAVRALDQFRSRPKVSGIESVIFAGVDNDLAPARLAVRFEAEGGTVFDPANYRKFLYITDAASGEILHQENRVLHQDIPGVVQGLATEGIGADICDDEVATGLPYARLTVGSTTIYANAMGEFTVPLVSSGTVNISSEVRGQYFVVNNQGGANSSISQSASSGVFATILHNEPNTSATYRAEVNAYLHANIVRDFALSQNPAYPVIAGQTSFPVNVNIVDTCNAFYNGSSINFFQAGGGCTNTANSTVVYHEYGHHLINVGGSGQGAYGEGMSDTVAVAITDSPLLGLGFQSNCNSPLRNADNTQQYPCSSPIHSCGRVLSGSVWDTREALVAAGVENYRELISSWVINSILLHSGTEITPQITIDFLTLDDDDDDISNGTPHYLQIDEGFSLHNMPAPPLSLVAFQYPAGLPQSSLPQGGTTFAVQLASLAGQPNGELSLAWRIAGSGSYTFVPATPLGGNLFEIAVPATECGNVIEFYLVAGAVGGGQATSPSEGANLPFSVLAATGLSQILYDDGGTSVGWSVSNQGGLTDGEWERGVPVGGGVRGDPAEDFEPEPNGACWLTANRAGNSDVDGGSTILTTPLLDASDPNSEVCYSRWYSNTFGASPNADIFVVEISGDGGTTWTNLETVGPAGPEADGGWFRVCFRVNQFIEPSANLRLRFNASDLGSGSVVEAAIDGLEVRVIECDEAAGPDLNGDGIVNGADLALLLSAWGGSGIGDLDGNGQINGADLAMLLGAWTS